VADDALTFMANRDISKWANVIDGAGIERRVRRVDAREIEEGKARREAEARGEEVHSDGTPKVTYSEAQAAVHAEVDDQSVAPKVSTKAKKAKS
jgi:hypothetical protein